MSILDRLRRRHPGLDPEEVRSRLFAAYAAHDGAGLAALCRDHADLIAAHFAEWKDGAKPAAGDDPRPQRHVETLAAIATFFGRVLGRSELERILVPPGEADPTQAWRRTLKHARALMEELDFERAAAMLGDFLIDVRHAPGSVADNYVAAANSLLGQCDFLRGRVQEAEAPLARAAEMCEAARQPGNLRANLETLFEVYRYLGRGEQAAAVAERIAELCLRVDEAPQGEYWRRQGAVLRAGEPLNRVVVRLGERYLELDQAFPEPGEGVELMYRRNRLTLRSAQLLVDEGERRSGAGDLEGALGRFRAAAARDRYDPHARYLAAIALACLERPAEAAQEFRETERLAPGWFNARAYLELSRAMIRGAVDPALFRPYTVMLAEGPRDPARRLGIADHLCRAHPEVALAHLGRGASLARMERKKEAAAAFRRGLDCARDEDMRTRLYLALGVVTEEPRERRALLETATDIGGNPMAAAMATLALRVQARSSATGPGG